MTKMNTLLAAKGRRGRGLKLKEPVTTDLNLRGSRRPRLAHRISPVHSVDVVCGCGMYEKDSTDR